MQMRLCQVYKKSCGGNRRELEKDVLRRQTRATGLSVSVTLLKSIFKLEAISAIYYLLAIEGKMFDVRLILEFSGAANDMPIIEWVKNVELVCEHCTVAPLDLQYGGHCADKMHPLLFDNDIAFTSKDFGEFVRNWDVYLRFQCAYSLSGNRIVERSHRTIKT